MKLKRLKLPALIMAIGILAALIGCLISGIIIVPTVTEGEFNYSVTYSLDGVVRTLNGAYICKYNGSGDRSDPRGRYYIGEYTDYGLAVHHGAYTIARKDGYDLAIVTDFNASYLMGDTKNEFYDDCVEEPYLLVFDTYSVECAEPGMLEMFDAEIIAFEYPEPIENSLAFAGFSMLYEISMLVMMLIGLLTAIVSVTLVKKDPEIEYGVLSKVGIVLNYITAIIIFPFLTLCSWLIHGLGSGPDQLYQIYLCVPAIIMFSVAASASLRRTGFAKSGFFIQLIGPALFFTVVLIEILV